MTAGESFEHFRVEGGVRRQHGQSEGAPPFAARSEAPRYLGRAVLHPSREALISFVDGDISKVRAGAGRQGNVILLAP